MNSNSEEKYNRYIPYVTGFITSIILTLAAFYFVESNVFEDIQLAIIISVLAIGQLFIQLYYFLHMGKESKPRWNLNSFAFMVLIVLILVVGSLWIMHNLNYSHTQNQNIDEVIMEEENIYR